MGEYPRVIPRDLYNEADLLKCYGRLVLELNAHPGHVAEVTYDDRPFDVVQKPADGSLSIENLQLKIVGRPWVLYRPLNSRLPWPLYAAPAIGCGPLDYEVSVFTGDGVFTEEFAKLIGLASL